MFDDFDIDYNKMLYLIETRVSGALTVPKSAVVFRKTAANSVLVVPTEPAFDGDEVTVPTITGVVYHQNTSTGTVMTTGTPVAVADGVTLHVVATPASGYHFSSNAIDEWDFTGV
jgi:hypothetical protein